MRPVNVWFENGHAMCQVQPDGRFYTKEEAEMEVAGLQAKLDHAEKVIATIREFVEEVAKEREAAKEPGVRNLTALAVRATAIKEFLYPEALDRGSR